MNVDNNLIGQVVKALSNQNGGSNNLNKFYGTVATVDGRKCVKLDGSDVYTAVVEGTEVMDGDRVLVGIENHQAVVYANITSPASARTATNFMDFSEDEGGLIIGELLDDDNEFNILIRPEGIFVRNGFGEEAIPLAKYDSNGVMLYDESGHPVARFIDNAMQIRSSDGDNEVIVKSDSVLMKYKNGDSYNYHRLAPSGLSFRNPNNSAYNSVVGSVVNSNANDTSETLASQGWQSVGYITLPFGVWLITFGGAFSAGSGGTRQFILNTTNDGTTPSLTRQDIVISPSGSHAVRAIQPRVVSVSSSPTTYYLHAYSGANEQLAVHPFIRAVRIG